LEGSERGKKTEKNFGVVGKRKNNFVKIIMSKVQVHFLDQNQVLG
jgi:membrane protein involved in colicin uptake